MELPKLSHLLNVLSSLPETIVSPSGLNTTVLISSEWPVKGLPVELPSLSQILNVLSALAETMSLAVWTYCGCIHFVSMTFQNGGSGY